MMKSWSWGLMGVGLLVASGAKAALGGLETTRKNVGLSSETLWVLIPKIMKWLFGFLGIIFLAMMIAGGIIWMTAQGNQDQVKKAQQLLTAAVIGLVVVVAAFALTAFLGDSFGPK